jgi:hypothetical protein
MANIIKTLHDELHQDPDILTLFQQAVNQTFFTRFPHHDISVITVDDTILVSIAGLTYSMPMTDDWADTDSFSFTFTNIDPPHDTIVVDLGNV